MFLISVKCAFPAAFVDLTTTMLVLCLIPGFCAPGFVVYQEVVLKSRVNWQVVRSDVAQMPWGVIIHSPVIGDVLDTELGKIIRIPSIEAKRRSGDEP